MAGEHRLVEWVVDDDATDLGRLVGVTVDEFEQGGAQIVEHPAEACTWSIRHGRQHLSELRSREPSLVRPGAQFQPLI
ncbi:hypothetical protein GCM10009554_02020 [Kribbella koreensis]|uniref:Lsr2 protein n=1 Tax=Kribbella koreensis TaxID=57909 RepID=A0ABP3ZKQ2_9ACTN